MVNTRCRRLDLEAEDPFEDTFDLIYSRDCFMHIVGKAEMYKKIKVGFALIDSSRYRLL